mmetsp:Transcript_7486/g.9974  ORF Transcript_7486/g.9974 Transcript_7486/m.9974 type:complete len:454 (+) Transcript_7486:260-1621(+)
MTMIEDNDYPRSRMVSKGSRYSSNIKAYIASVIAFGLLSLQLASQTAYSFPIEITNSLSASRRNVLQSFVGSIILVNKMSSHANNQVPSKINWGIVGLGDVCAVKSGPPFYKCEGSELAAVMRRTPNKAKEFAANVPGGRCVGYEDLDEFLCHPNLDAVYVSTRPGTHLEICEKVANAGKACYVEKPVGRCAEETEKIEQIFKEKRLPLYTAYISRAFEKTQTIKQLLSTDVIGEVKSIKYMVRGHAGARDLDSDLPWRLIAAESGGGLIMDVGCHVIDRIDYLFGPIQNISSKVENRSGKQDIAVEDYVAIKAQIGSSSSAATKSEGASVDLVWDFTSSEEPCDKLEIVGSKGILRTNGPPAEPLNICDGNGEILKTFEFEMPQHTGQGLIQAVTDDLRGVRKSDIVSYGENAIRAQKVLDTSLNSYYGGREVGYWNREESWPGNPKAAFSH